MRYAAWLAAPVAILCLAIWASPRVDPRFPPERSLADQLSVKDAKLRRTLRSFDPREPEEGAPLPLTEGLPIAVDVDPDAIALRLIKANRARLKGRRTDAFVRFADGPALPATLRIRGNSTLREGEKLNFVVELLRPQRFGDGIVMKKLFLIAMAHDPHQIVLRFGYTVFSELGLYPPLFQYSRLALNGEPQGLYLLLEPPREGLRRIHDDLVGLYRRKGRGMYDVEWTGEVRDVEESIRRLRDLRYIADLPDPVDAYDRFIDLDAYLRYLAVNSILLNQDMLAELFFYERREDPDVPSRLALMAWDLDDIGSDLPKEGAVVDPLIFSGQDRLDFQIHEQAPLYARYREILKELLEDRLTPEYLSATLRGAVALRNSLDDGLDPAVQREAREARGRFARGLEERLLARHERLSRLLREAEDL